MARRRTVLAGWVGAVLAPATAAPAFAITRNPAPSSSTDGRVEASVEIGSDLYVGGRFSTVDGTPRTNLVLRV